MKKERKSLQAIICIMMIFVMAISMVSCSGNPSENLDKEIETASEWIKEMTPAPSTGAIGGEWAVIGLAASGISAEENQEYFDLYYDDVRAKAKANKGILDEKYSTAYARVSLGLAAIGKSPEDVEGYNLFEPLDEAEAVTGQGLNAVTFALIASNVTGISLDNEEKYVDLLVDEIETEKLYNDERFVDYVAMCMQGLSYYMNQEKVKNTVEHCIMGLSAQQQEDGSFGNCESTVEVIIGLTAVGIDPVNDQRFTKNGKSLLDGLMEYKEDDGYVHINGESSDKFNPLMPTEKALLALDSIRLFREGKKLYESER
ncbi:MAG: hypothetical protein ACLRWH_00395 [Emergencia sp.]